MSSTQLFGRVYSLTLVNSTIGSGGGNGSFAGLLNPLSSNALDLSALHFTFEVRQSDTETPNHATVRVYNVAPATLKSILAEFDTVILQAGYPSQIGVIFQGTIVQFRTGREKNVDDFLDIVAFDGDSSYNFAFMNQTLNPGSSSHDVAQATADSMGVSLDANALNNIPLVIYPRGKVMFGLARLFNRDLANTAQCRWSIQNGVLTFIPITGYKPSDIVEINSTTGMIGVPESTDNGISIQILMNPKIKIGTRVRINEDDINQATVKDLTGLSLISQEFTSKLSVDGTYRVLAIDHTGDNRGTEWYSHLTCLAISNPGAPSTGGAVLAAG